MLAYENTGRTPDVPKWEQTTILSTSKNILFPGHDHLLTSADDPSFAGAGQ